MEHSTKNKLIALAIKEITEKHFGDNKAMGEAMVKAGEELKYQHLIDKGNELVRHSLKRGLIR